MKSKIIYHIAIMTVFSIVWSILNEKFSIINIVLGAILGLFFEFITNNIIIRNPKSKNAYYNLPVIKILFFIFVLIFQIFKSGIYAIKKIVKGNVITRIIEVETNINNDLLITILASSITLTPGTVTIDRQNNTLKVLVFCSKDDDEKELAKQILLPFKLIVGGNE